MTKLVSVQFQNFQSYGSVPTTIDFSQSGVTIIGGKNGVGKSSIINAISYGLYDKPVSDISKDGLINNINKKNMEVIVQFVKNKKNYKIRRYRKMKGNGVEIWEDEKDITPDSISNANAVIEGILEMPHDLFVRVIIFSAINTQFLNLPMRTQSDMLEELLDLKMLSTKADVLKEQIKDTKTSIEMENNKIEQANIDCRNFFNRYTKALQRVQNWDKTNNDEIQQINQTLNNLKSIDVNSQIDLHKKAEDIEKLISDSERLIETLQKDVEHEQSIFDELKQANEMAVLWEQNHKETIKTYTEKVKQFENLDIDAKLIVVQQYNELKKELDKLSKEQISLDNDISEMTQAIADNTNQLEHLNSDTCPYCKQHFKDTKEKIKECETNIKILSEERAKTQSSLNDIDKYHETTHNNMMKLKDNMDMSEIELHAAQEQYIKSKEQLKNTKNDINEWTHIITNLESKTNESKLEKLKNELNKKIKNIELLVNNLNDVDAKTTMSLLEIQNHTDKLKLNEAKLLDLTNSTNPMVEPFNELSEECCTIDNKIKYVDLISKSVYDINKSDIQIPLDYKFIDDTKRKDYLHKLSEHQQFLLKLLTNKNSFIRKTMLNQTIPFLNNQLDGYLKTMNLPHSVTFTPKMEIKISQLGNTLQYGNLSNGQSCRVNLALSFAFRDVLQYLHDPINVLVLDEVLDVGLDSEGIQNAASMIKQKAEHDQSSMYIISHRDELDNVFNNRIEIQLKDGFSQII